MIVLDVRVQDVIRVLVAECDRNNGHGRLTPGFCLKEQVSRFDIAVCKLNYAVRISSRHVVQGLAVGLGVRVKAGGIPGCSTAQQGITDRNIYLGDNCKVPF